MLRRNKIEIKKVKGERRAKYVGNNFRILGVIPARGGSKGIPRKNIKSLFGKPLLYYILKAALGSKLLTDIVVSSEDKEILSVAKKYGGNRVVLKRPASLSKDSTPDVPVLRHAVKTVESERKCRFNFVVLLHATTPLTLPEDVDGVLLKLIDSGADSVVSVYRLSDLHPMKMKKIVNDRLVSYVPSMKEKTTTSRHSYEPIYRRNTAIYASRRAVIMENGTVWGRDTRPYIMPPERSVDINEPLDFLIAETLLKSRKIVAK